MFDARLGSDEGRPEGAASPLQQTYITHADPSSLRRNDPYDSNKYGF